MRHFLNMAIPRYTSNSNAFPKIYLDIKMLDFTAKKKETTLAGFISIFDKMYVKQGKIITINFINFTCQITKTRINLITRIPRIGYVAMPNNSQTRQICQIYIPGQGLC